MSPLLKLSLGAMAFVIAGALLQGALIDVGKPYLVPEVKEASDFSNTVYIDPEASTNGAGTIQSPKNTLSGLTFASNTAYLIKAGTVLNERLYYPPSNFYLGRYGEGDNPILRGSVEMVVIGAVTDVTINGVDIEKYGPGGYDKIIGLNEAGSYVTFANLRIHGLKGVDDNYPYYGLQSKCQFLTFYKCDIGYVKGDTLYPNSISDMVVVSCYLHHINMSEATGDGLQIGANSHRLYFANNYVDRGTTIKKFGLAAITDGGTDIVCVWNTFISPLEGGGGSSIYWVVADRNICSKNLIISTTANISGIASFDVCANQPAPYGVRDNHFYGPGNMFYGFTPTATDNYSFTDEAAYQAYLTANNLAAYGSDLFLEADTVAPTVPQSLSGSASSNTVSLSWSASTDNVGVAGYRIYRNSSMVGTTSSTSYTDTDLAYSTAYSYTVAAVDASGNLSAQSSAISVTTGATQDITAPSVPTNLAASGVTTTSFSLSWSAATDNVGVAGYVVYLSGFSPIDVGNVTSATITGLTSATIYSASVSAYDAADNESAASSSINVTTSSGSSGSAVRALIDLGDNVHLVTQNGWNSISHDMLAITDLEDSAGDSTGIALSVTSTGSIYSKAKGVTTVVDPDWPIEASQDAIYGNGGSMITLEFTGLDTANTYDFTLYASRTDYGTGRGALYRIYSGTASGSVIASATLDAGVATSVPVVLSEISPSASGLITLTMIADPNDGNTGRDDFYLGVIELVGVPSSDTEAPSVPTGLSATNVAGSSVSLTWNAATDNVGVVGYAIFRDSVEIDTVAGTSYTDTGLDDATTYSYSVSAFDGAANESTTSSALQVTTLDTTAPSATSGLTYANVTTSTVDLSWNAATDNVGVAGYSVSLSGIGAVDVGNVTSVTLTGLSANVSYYATVAAYDAADNQGPASNGVNFITQPLPTSSGTVRIDLGDNVHLISQAGWNSITHSVLAITDLVDSAGDSSGIALSVTSTGTISSRAKGVTTVVDPDWPIDASQDAIYGTGGSTITLEFTGLNPADTYDFTLYASRTDYGTGRGALYRIYSGTASGSVIASATLDAGVATSVPVVLSSVSPDANGLITLTMVADPNDGNTGRDDFYLGVVEINN